MYILNISIRKMSVNELRERSYYSMKRLKKKRFAVFCNQINRKKIPDPRNGKEHYQSSIKKKSRKSVK